MIHGHGDDLYKTEKEITANFSTNVWYGADSNLLQSLLNRHADKIFHYPEPDAGSASATSNTQPASIKASLF